MKYVFKRNSKASLEKWSAINRELQATLDAVINGEFTEEELSDFCSKAVCDGKPLSHNLKMVFWGYDEPETMPSDGRCEFFYLPTYLMVLTMVAAVNRYPDLMKVDGVEDALSRGLFACTGRDLMGSGYERYAILLENLTMFINAGIVAFLRNHPGIGGTFRDVFSEQIVRIRDDYNSGCHVFDWNQDFRKEQKELLDLYDGYEKQNQAPMVFVYGTLLKGQCNYGSYLAPLDPVDEGVVNGYKMVDVGSFPGIVAGDGKVKGEIYQVSCGQLADIDSLEGEGSLYIRKYVNVETKQHGVMQAYVYVYNRSAAHLPEIPFTQQPYGHENMVWYVAYGSNLLEERLKNYIMGGKCKFNSKTYRACSDTRMPRRSVPVIIPYSMYYSGKSNSWEGKPVCFLDISKPGMAYGRAYLVNESQLDWIHWQEGKSSEWYKKRVRLEDIEGIPAYAFTNPKGKEHQPFNMVSKAYQKVLLSGLKESYPDMDDAAILKYLVECEK